MKVHVVARSEEHASLFSIRNPSIRDVQFHCGQTSYFRLLDKIIADGTDDIVCVVHDDVYLPIGFDIRVSGLVNELQQDWPNWGACGNSGISAIQVGYSPTLRVRYLSGPLGGPNFQGRILPAQSVDGNVLLINSKALRKRAVKLPPFEGFQLYDLCLSIEILCAGLALLLAPQLACFHDSRGERRFFDKAARSSKFKNYANEKVANRVIHTSNGDVIVGHGEGIDIELEALRCAAEGRLPKSVAIIVRTQFKRPNLLNRTIMSIQSFIAAMPSGRERFRCYLVTDATLPEMANLPEGVSVLSVAADQKSDSRNRLAMEAIRTVSEEYVWFVDDDDWLFPNEARRLCYALATAPCNSLFFLDTRYFKEDPTATDAGAFPPSSVSTLFSASCFSSGLNGNNRIPFCGMILPRSVVARMPPESEERVLYYEDYALQLFALLDSSVVPIVIEKLVAGISIRPTGNSVTETDRTKWNQSSAEIASLLCCDDRNPTFFNRQVSGSGVALSRGEERAVDWARKTRKFGKAFSRIFKR